MGLIVNSTSGYNQKWKLAQISVQNNAVQNYGTSGVILSEHAPAKYSKRQS